MHKFRYRIKSAAEQKESIKENEDRENSYSFIEVFNLTDSRKNPEVAAVIKAIDKYAKKCDKTFKGEIIDVYNNINLGTGTWVCEQYPDGLAIKVKLDRDRKEIKAYASETLVCRRKFSEKYDFIEDLAKEFVKLIVKKF